MLDLSQLDTLAAHLVSKENELVNLQLDILYEYIIERHIEPSNKDKLLENLRVLLKDRPVPAAYEFRGYGKHHAELWVCLA